MTDIITLSADGWQVAVAPEIGASITVCRFDEQPILRVVDGALGDRFTPEDAACFPLVPFSNRIENGQVKCQDSVVELPPNHHAQSHPLHGYGWLSKWDIISVQNASCELNSSHTEGDWPWPFEARYSFEVSGNVFIQKLSIKNTGATSMPVGLGFHPYLTNAEDAKLQFSAQGMWQSDDDILPVNLEIYGSDFPFQKPAPICGKHYDHCFSGWDGRAYVEWGTAAYDVAISASSNCNHAVLYAPQNESFFCFEPATHMNNVMSGRYPSPHGDVEILAPNEVYAAEMRFEVKRKATSQ